MTLPKGQTRIISQNCQKMTIKTKLGNDLVHNKLVVDSNNSCVINCRLIITNNTLATYVCLWPLYHFNECFYWTSSSKNEKVPITQPIAQSLKKKEKS